MNKIFIIGLPRTGTTSVCAALLEQDLKVAHTAYSKHTFTLADVIADTPCYCDYQQLDQLFPNSKFIYLERALDTWLPSIQMLLQKISPYIKPEGKFNPILKRCFNSTFSLSTVPDPCSSKHLTSCYKNHQQEVINYFSNRIDWLRITINQTNSYAELMQFLGLKHGPNDNFPHLNQGRMITAWKDIKHPNKVNSDAFGPERRQFFNYVE